MKNAMQQRPYEGTGTYRLTKQHKRSNMIKLYAVTLSIGSWNYCLPHMTIREVNIVFPQLYDSARLLDKDDMYGFDEYLKNKKEISISIRRVK